MFLDRPSNRIKITQKLRQFIIDEREKVGLSATALAKEIEHPQSWVAQVESGRTKSIKYEDFVSIFRVVLNSDSITANKYLVDNIDRFTINNSIQEKLGIDEDINETSVDIFTYEEKPDDVKLKDEYQKLIKHLNDGLLIFFDRVKDKEKAVKLLGSFIMNLHKDMGFALSIASLPYRKLEKKDKDLKQQIFNSVLDQIIGCSNEDITKDRENQVDQPDET